MSADEAGEAAQQVITRLGREVEARTLAPFGDGPIELEIAEELRARFEGTVTLSVALDRLFRQVWGAIIDPDAPIAAFRLFASVSFVLRFCGEAPRPRLAEAAIQLLVERAADDREARFALADLVRTLARTGDVPIDLEVLRFDAESDDPEILTAIAELLAELGSPETMPLLATLVGRGVDLSPLFWNLAQQPAFADLMEQSTFDVRTDVRRGLEEALLEMDPQGRALKAWQDLVLENAAEEGPGWAALDYRLLEMAA